MRVVNRLALASKFPCLSGTGDSGLWELVSQATDGVLPALGRALHAGLQATQLLASLAQGPASVTELDPSNVNKVELSFPTACRICLH